MEMQCDTFEIQKNDENKRIERQMIGTHLHQSTGSTGMYPETREPQLRFVQTRLPVRIQSWMINLISATGTVQ